LAALRKYLKFIILTLVAVLILWYFARNLNWSEVAESLRKADPFYITLSILLICVGYLLRAIRWKVLLLPITESSLTELFATTTVGFAAIFLIGRAGEIVRPMWLPMRDRRVRPSAALVTLGLERIFDLAALVCFFSINLIWFTPQAGREAEFQWVEIVGWLLLVGVGIGFVFLFIYQRVSDRFIVWFERFTDRRWIPKRVQKIMLSILEQLSAALGILKDWREMVWLIFWTFALWMSIALPTWYILLAFDLQTSFSDSLFIMGFATIASVVPTPGGAAGAFHTATANSLVFLDNRINYDQAAAVANVMHLVYFAPAIIFGLYYFFHGDISIERFRSLISSEHAVEEIETDSPDFEQVGSESGPPSPEN
jgi:uncharacterized protein (TIRG00374 family)